MAPVVVLVAVAGAAVVVADLPSPAEVVVVGWVEGVEVAALPNKLVVAAGAG